MPSDRRRKCWWGCQEERRQLDHLWERIPRFLWPTSQNIATDQPGSRKQWEDEGFVPHFGRIPALSELHHWSQGPWWFNPRGGCGLCSASSRLWWEVFLRPKWRIWMEQREGAEDTEKTLHGKVDRPCGFQPRSLRLCGFCYQKTLGRSSSQVRLFLHGIRMHPLQTHQWRHRWGL